jgi:hypothetical protein
MTRVPPTPCIHCGHINDYAADVLGDHRVKPGDIAICFQCAGVMTYDEELKLIELAEGEIEEFDEQLKIAIRVTRDCIARKKRKLN